MAPQIAAANARAASAAANAPANAQRLALGKLTAEEGVIANTNRQIDSDVSTIKQINRLNAIAADPARRKQAFPGDTAIVVISKIQDERTGVKEGEVARVTGLGTGAIDKVFNLLKRASAGQILSESQWSQLLAVANLTGKKAQENIDRVRTQREPSLREAGIDPKNVFGVLPEFEAFDFTAFGKPGSAINAELKRGAKFAPAAAADPLSRLTPAQKAQAARELQVDENDPQFAQKFAAAFADYRVRKGGAAPASAAPAAAPEAPEQEAAATPAITGTAVASPSAAPSAPGDELLGDVVPPEEAAEDEEEL
jgi:hypothetical protein